MSDKINKVTYKTFVNDLSSKEVEKADLYSYGSVDFTYLTTSGELRAVDIPSEASENDLLIDSLGSKDVPYISHNEPYPHDDNDSSSYMMWSGSIIFIIPLLLIGIIFYQARVISKLSNKMIMAKAETPDKTNTMANQAQ